MNKEDRLRNIYDLREASPLQMPSLLMQAELYDCDDAQAVIDEVYLEFKGGSHMTENVLLPIMAAIADRIIVAVPALRKRGLDATRIMKECERFTYDDTAHSSDLSIRNKHANADDKLSEFATKERGEFERSTYVDQNAIDKYKNEKSSQTRGKNIEDEYTGKKNITVGIDNVDRRRNDPTRRHQAQTDHVVPLKEVHNQYAGNLALSDNDIRIIANGRENLALTSAKRNQEKGARTNADYVNKNEVSPAVRERMLSKGRSAQLRMSHNANQMLLKNLTGRGTVSSAEKKQAMEDFKRTTGRAPTTSEKAQLESKLQIGKTKKIYSRVSDNAAKQAKDYAIGNVILFALKPIYFELKDMVTNGLEEGVGASSKGQALAIRFTRVRKYMSENLSSFVGDNMLAFVQGFVSSLVEGILSVFIGIFKQFLRAIKEGFIVFIKSAKILFGKESQQLTAAQKGDAIVKIIGGAIVALGGIAVEALLNRIGLGEPWSIILSVMLTGIGSAVFMYLLDKIDLFSVKVEQRARRIKEIFDARIQDIKDAQEAFAQSALKTMCEQRMHYDRMSHEANVALAKNDFTSLNVTLLKMADFFKIELPYQSTKEFMTLFDEDAVLEI